MIRSIACVFQYCGGRSGRARAAASRVHDAPSSADCPVLAHPYAAQGTTHKNTAGDMNTHMNIYIQHVRTPTCRGAFKESGMHFSDAIKPISQPVSGKLVHKLVSGAQN